MNKSKNTAPILLTLNKSCYFADCEHVIIISHFVSFEHVILICHFANFEQVKKTVKLLWEKPDAYALLFFSQPPLVSSLTLPWTIARFFDPFYTFSPAHRRVIHNFTLPPFECIGIQFFNLYTCD